MKVVIQRVKQAAVEVDGKKVGAIGKGMVVLLGIKKGDTEKEADFLAQKIIDLRIFEDEQGKMNISGLEAGASFLVVSQFTLYGDCQKGRRPSFDEAALPQEANKLYRYFIEVLKQKGANVAEGEFGAMMDVSLINAGPVTFILESAAK